MLEKYIPHKHVFFLTESTEAQSPNLKDWISDQLGIPSELFVPDFLFIQLLVASGIISYKYIFPRFELIGHFIKQKISQRRTLANVSSFYDEMRTLKDTIQAERVTLLMIEQEPKVGKITLLYKVHSVGSNRSEPICEYLSSDGIPIDETFSRIITKLESHQTVVYETEDLNSRKLRAVYKKAGIHHSIWCEVKTKGCSFYFLACDYKKPKWSAAGINYQKHINLILLAADKLTKLY